MKPRVRKTANGDGELLLRDASPVRLNEGTHGLLSEGALDLANALFGSRIAAAPLLAGGPLSAGRLRAARIAFGRIAVE